MVLAIGRGGIQASARNDSSKKSIVNVLIAFFVIIMWHNYVRFVFFIAQ